MSKFKKEVEEAFGPLAEEPAVQGNLSPEEIVRRQLDRTAISRSLGEEIWEANVMMCLSFLPTNKREEIHERLDEYNTKKVDLRRVWCGRRMPSRDGEPEWEFGVDYQKLFEIVVTGFEECGLTWRTKTESVELGKIEAKPPKPTPVFDEPIKDMSSEDTSPSHEDVKDVMSQTNIARRDYEA